MTAETDKLTKQQIENWRSVLVGMIGPYALLMTDEQVQNIRDQYQGKIDQAFPEPSDGKE
jgi:trans-aconitate methyltransferase